MGTVKLYDQFLNLFIVIYLNITRIQNEVFWVSAMLAQTTWICSDGPAKEKPKYQIVEQLAVCAWS